MKQSIGPKAIIFPTPVLIVGSYGEHDEPNIMNVAWGGICSSAPPSIAVSIRGERHTHANILKHRAFTVNIPSVSQVRPADYAGLCSGRDTDKFAETGLTPVSSDRVHAPYVAEFPLCLECRLIQIFDLGAHTQFVGEILDVKANKEVLNREGQIDIEKVEPFSFSPADGGYYRLGAFIGQAFSIGRKD